MNGLILFVCLAIFPQNNLIEKTPAQIFQETKHVVYLEIGYMEEEKDENGKESFYQNYVRCSGFAFRDKDGVWILGPGHAIDKGEKRLSGPSIAYFPTSQKILPQDIVFVGYDSDIDCSLFKFKNPEQLKNLPLAILGSSQDLKAGEQVVSIGNPVPTRFSIRVGWISNLNFTGFIINGRQPQLIVHTCQVSPGSSGEPLINLKGEVVGINVMYFPPPSQDARATTYSLAVPIDDVKFLLPKLKLGGKIEHPPIGLINFTNSYNLHESDLEALDIIDRPEKEGVIVIKVRPYSLPELAGFEPGDLIISCNGKPVINFIDFLKMIYLRNEPSEILKIEINRYGEKIILPLLLVDLSAPQSP